MANTNGRSVELDAVENIAVSIMTEPKFMKAPRMKVKNALQHADREEIITLDNLPAPPFMEARFLRHPKTELLLKRTYHRNGTNLDVSPMTEAMFLKTRVSATTPKSRQLSDVVRRPGKTSTWADASTANINETDQGKHGLFTLPREIRDEIYRYLFCHRFCVILPQSQIPTPKPNDKEVRRYHTARMSRSKPGPQITWSQQGPRRSEPLQQTDTVAPWADAAPGRPITQPQQKLNRCRPLHQMDTVAPWGDRAPVHDVWRPYEEREYNRRLQKRWNLVTPSECMPLLLASKATHEEAATEFYNAGTFIFIVSDPSRFSHIPTVVKRMKSVWIHIDLNKSHSDNRSVGDMAFLLAIGHDLIHTIGGTKTKKKLCIISIDNAWRHISFPGPIMSSIKTLTAFETVVLRFTLPYDIIWIRSQYRRPSRAPQSKSQVSVYHQIFSLVMVDLMLSPVLGPGRMEFGHYDFCYLVYHPYNHQTGSRAPDFDINELDDPMDLFPGNSR